MPDARSERLFATVRSGRATDQEAERFRGQMLTEMAAMSVDDSLVMQIHPGSWRNHNPQLYEDFGRDKGADIPTRTDYVGALKPLLDRFGNSPALTLVLFTLDETTYARELGRWPDTTRACGWGRRGGSTTASRACAATSRR